MKYLNVMLAGALLLTVAQAFAADVKTIEAVYKERAQLAGKQVTVTGTVVKVNNGIMKRNFLHIQDGTGKEGTNDLTITSNQTASKGQKVTITGTVVLDTDFGMGYAYPLLVEKSSIQVK
ncbi:MAG: hypothetical protein P8Y24_14010 [Gammaproteobacteria bacterium]|jgi:hypothetical protein